MLDERDQKRTPHGPYVDNTQKWTDLALKRVLHEAAHGGYDKVAFTPGDQQNKRWPGYDLTKYYDEIMPKRLQALAQQHDPQAKVRLKGERIKTHGEWPFPIEVSSDGTNYWLSGRSPHNEEPKGRLSENFSSYKIGRAHV